jgi:phosphoribosylanthranilate isomerase
MWIKICGIRDVSTAREVARLGADAIGLNFYAPSPRCVSVETAAQIVAALPDSVEPVGVFVNHSLAEVRDICNRCRLRTIQLHGDESPQFAAELHELRIIRAVRLDGPDLSSLAADLAACRTLSIELRAYLIESRVDGAYGGTGRLAPWDVLGIGWNASNWPPLLLAGGLTPENVADAIRRTRPWGVDVASGVEDAPGHKDLLRVEQFVRAARAAS